VPTLDITSLRSLVAVGSFAGVRRAADALHLSQAAVSGHLRRLEHELGFPIVTRQGRAIAFTARGDDVLREAHRLLDAHDAALARLAVTEVDDLVVASTEHASEIMLRVVGAELREAYPGRRVRYVFHRSARVREFVHDHAVDVAVGFGDLGAGTRSIADLPLTWVGPAHTDPRRDRLVVFARPCVIRDRILASAAVTGAVIAQECLDLAGLAAAVRSGVGVSAVPAGRELEPGIRPLDGLPTLPGVPLSVVTSARLGTDVARRIDVALGRAWTA
jgi:DNA-binding transcriptional LysR family regulator